MWERIGGFILGGVGIMLVLFIAVPFITKRKFRNDILPKSTKGKEDHENVLSNESPYISHTPLFGDIQSTSWIQTPLTITETSPRSLVIRGMAGDKSNERKKETRKSHRSRKNRKNHQ